MSDGAKRDAWRSPSRPLGVAVAKASGGGVGEIAKAGDGDGKGLTDAEGTIPLLTDAEATTDPKPTLPLTLIRTAGRR